MADKDRFGRSEREYTGVTNRTGDNRRRFGRSERAYSGVTDSPFDRYLRFGPSEKEYTEASYKPLGRGTTWDYTGDFRRKIPGYDLGSRPPRGLESLMLKQGMIGQDPRSTTYGPSWTYLQTSPDDLSGYRRSVADVAAANAAEEQERLRKKYRYAFTNPGSGLGIEETSPGIGNVVPKDPRDVGVMSEFAFDWPVTASGPRYQPTDDMSDYRQSWDPHMTEQAALNLKLLGDLDRGGTDAYRFAKTAPVSIGEREAFRSPATYEGVLPDNMFETPFKQPDVPTNPITDSINRIRDLYNTPYRYGLGDHPGRHVGFYNRGGIASLRR